MPGESAGEEQPADRDRRFRLLLDTLPFIAFVVANGGQAEFYNKCFAEYVGFVPGPDTSSRTALHHPDDQPLLEAARDAGISGDREYIVEARLLRHDGAYRWHRISNVPLHHDGRRTAWLGTAIDVHESRQAKDLLEQRVQDRTAELEEANRRLLAEVHERQQAERVLRDSEIRFRTMYNRTPMALQSVDAAARLIDVNDTWVEMFGYARQEVIGRPPTDFMTAESARIYRERSWPAMLASGGLTRSVDYQFVTRSGRVFDARLVARGDFDAEGRFVRSWTAIADVTAEKRADEKLRHAQRLEAVGQLTAGVAHDFNNLLTAVLGNLEIIARRPQALDERTARMVAGARAAAERGARLTQQLLAFSRQQRITAAPVALDRALEEMLPLLHATLGDASTIRLLPGQDVAPALADRSQLELAILNLVINARDAMAPGGVITLSTANVTRGPPARPEEPEAGDYAAVTVRDQGPGIPDAVRDTMFEPFFTTKPAGKGSGLGLAQVLGVAKQLGGGIAVSTGEAGTGFTLFLPRASHPAGPDAPAGEAASGPDLCGAVLLVDDDASVRAVVAEMLRDAGHRVTEASSGLEALAALNGGAEADVLVADVVMPGMSGKELADIVRRTWPALAVVYMTGYADEHRLPADVQDAVLRKPFRIEELLRRVAEALPAG